MSKEQQQNVKREDAREGAGREKAVYKYFEFTPEGVDLVVPVQEWDLRPFLSKEEYEDFQSSKTGSAEERARLDIYFEKAVTGFLGRYTEAMRSFQDELLLVMTEIQEGREAAARFSYVKDANGKITGLTRTVQFKPKGKHFGQELRVHKGDYQAAELAAYAERFDELPHFLTANTNGDAIIRQGAVVQPATVLQFAKLAEERQGAGTLFVDDGWSVEHGKEMPRNHAPLNDARGLSFHVEQMSEDLQHHREAL